MTASEFFSILRNALPTREDIELALDPDEIDGWVQAAGGDRIDAQRTMNHRHVTDMLSGLNWDEDFDVRDLITFAHIHAACLRDMLSRDYADQNFIVEVFGEETVEDDPLELIVTFHRPPA